LNILILEDEWFNAQYIKKSLESLGHNVVSTIDNAKDTIQCVQEFNIDLAFFDINVNGSMDGIECAKIINEHYNIPIIYLSAYNDNQTMEEIKLTNSYGFIKKPFDSEDIKLALNEFFQKNELKEKKNTIIKLANNYIFDNRVNKLYFNTKEVKLTKREIELISILSTKINTTIKPEKIIYHIWKEKKTNSTLRDLVSRLRKKVPLLKLNNIHGSGYVLSS